jgi:hypothetical protein
MLAALDPGTWKMIYRIRERKRWQEFLALLKVLRRRWPGQRLRRPKTSFTPDSVIRTWRDYKINAA